MTGLSFNPGQPGHEELARDWRGAAAELALACAGSCAAHDANRLRECLALLQACPAGFRTGLTIPEGSRIEALISADARASAALALFDGSEAAYLLSRGPGGSHFASVILPDAEEASAGGDTVALALVSAVALALSELALSELAGSGPVSSEPGFSGAARPVRRAPGGSLLN